MITKSNKKLSTTLSSMTHQELAVRQLLLCEDIPFTFQQKIQLSDRYYVIDFFIKDFILLECSFSTMYKVNTAFKQKAIHIEAKCVQLKKDYDYPFLVLFESIRPVCVSLLTTLHRLMPSIDCILTSRLLLLELLLGTEDLSTSVQFTNSVRTSPRQILPINKDNRCITNIINSPNLLNNVNYTSKCENELKLHFLEESRNIFYFAASPFASKIHSLNVKKEFREEINQTEP